MRGLGKKLEQDAMQINRILLWSRKPLSLPKLLSPHAIT
jgi:hypothetical protein